jgi:hypothetical protein
MAAAETIGHLFDRVSDIMTDLVSAKSVELLRSENGVTWVNVDGLCVLRIREVSGPLEVSDLYDWQESSS